MSYFKPSEFACKCCGSIGINPDFVKMLEEAREVAGVPFVITSGYRCQKHNKAVGSTSTNHTSGKAADIKATDGPTRGKILRGLYLAGFKRVGVAKDFIHADISDSVESCWLY